MRSELPRLPVPRKQATTRAEDPGAEFRQNVAFMWETILEAAVPQPAPAQQKAVPMSANQAEETPKGEVPLSLFVKAKFTKLSAELAGCVDSSEKRTLGGRPTPRQAPREA